MFSDLLEHVGTKHAGDEGAFNDQHQNSHQSHAVCLLTQGGHVVRSI